MITEKEKLLNRLQALISLDQNDATAVHVDFDNLVRVLGSFNYILRPAKFEEALQQVLDANVVGKAMTGNPGLLKYVLAQAILEVAETMNMGKNSLLSHYRNMKTQDVIRPEQG